MNSNAIPESWREVAIEDIKAEAPNALSTGPFGSNMGSRFFQNSGVPVIRGSNLSQDIGERLVPTDLVFLSEEKAMEFERSKVKLGDLIFTCWGTIDQVGLIDKRSPYSEYIISNKQMKLTPNPERADSLFLYYLFSSPEMTERIRNQGIGSSVPGFNLGQLRSMRVRLPSLPEQRAIARILGSLDDKIELNRRMNETFEAVARAIFKSWFVDFDPIRVKAAGREPAGMDAKITKLFPCNLEENELGEIPEGWKFVKLSDICDTQYGYTESASDNPIGPRFLRVMDINKQDWIEWHKVPYCQISESDYKKYHLNIGDIVVARMADPGKSAIIDSDVDAVFASYLVRIKLKSLALSYYIHEFLKSDKYAEYVEGAKSGSVQANMNAKIITDIVLILPPSNVLDEFLKLMSSLHNRLNFNIEESLTLSKLRDFLLPKFLSGEVRIKL
jgi:restriction endonuclease S subunit